MDRQAAGRAIELLLLSLGHEPTGALAQTPALAAAAWCDELLAGERVDPGAVLREGALAARGADLVVVRGLDAATICPHHLLPSIGRAEVAYLPGARVAGFGAIARALHACTRRLTLQEDAGRLLCDLLLAELGARGAAVRLDLVHACLALRGAAQPSARVTTLALGGSFAVAGADRDLALSALGSRSPSEPVEARRRGEPPGGHP